MTALQVFCSVLPVSPQVAWAFFSCSLSWSICVLSEEHSFSLCLFSFLALCRSASSPWAETACLSASATLLRIFSRACRRSASDCLSRASLFWIAWEMVTVRICHRQNVSDLYIQFVYVCLLTWSHCLWAASSSPSRLATFCSRESPCARLRPSSTASAWSFLTCSCSRCTSAKHTADWNQCENRVRKWVASSLTCRTGISVPCQLQLADPQLLGTLTAALQRLEQRLRTNTHTSTNMQSHLTAVKLLWLCLGGVVLMPGALEGPT